ncbi:MAG: glycosyltransferase, partial [Treponema sp.]|nr:glycosyltransferase [Treponema sp.]
MLSISEDDITKNWVPVDNGLSVVSIQCMAFNHGPYIAAALEGFLSQKTDFPFEIVVHDDASQDNTADIIREYESRYPKIIKALY